MSTLPSPRSNNRLQSSLKQSNKEQSKNSSKARPPSQSSGSLRAGAPRNNSQMQTAVLIRKKLEEIAERVTAGRVPVFTDDDSVVDLGLIDSPGIIEFVLWIESQFGFEISESEVTVENLSTVSATARFIGRRSVG
ncbi:acyl carrier protein [SAR202 cluster bacterium AD-812-D07_MRT_10900m]|nr:acyl carrier protein [SAR202 cluster bacterium AD-812-D07_MRT_10900m]